MNTYNTTFTIYNTIPSIQSSTWSTTPPASRDEIVTTPVSGGSSGNVTVDKNGNSMFDSTTTIAITLRPSALTAHAVKMCLPFCSSAVSQPQVYGACST